MTHKRGFLILILVSVLVGAATLVTPVFIQAQTTTDTTASSLLTPQVFISNIVLDKTSYNPGDTITGKADFVNRGNSPSSDIYFNVMLVGNFVNRVPQDIYDTVKKGPVTLDVGQKKTVGFSYVIPTGYAGDNMGIRVQAVMKSGSKMGWSDTRFAVNGENNNVDATDAYVLVNEKQYSTGAGPTIYPGDEPSYQVTLINTSKQKVMLTPTVSVYKFGSDEEVMSNVKGVPVSLDINEKKVVTVPLPDMDYVAGVYYGRLNFVDQSKDIKSQLFTFRYIVGGNLVTIQTVSTDRTNVKAGDVVNSTITFTGAPRNVDDGKTPEVGNVTMTVVATNEDGDEVGRAVQSVLANKSVQSVVIPIQMSSTAHTLKFDVTARKGDMILSHYTSNSLVPRNSGLELPGSAVFVGSGLLVVFSVFLLVIVGLILVIKNRRGAKKAPHIAGMGAVLSVFIVLVAVFFTLKSDKLLAFFYVLSTPEDWRPLFINLPYEYQQFSPGQSFYIEGVALFYECDNEDLGTRVLYVNINGVNYPSIQLGDPMYATASSSPYATHTEINDTFSIGPYTAPSTPGDYVIYLTYVVSRSYEGAPLADYVEMAGVRIEVAGNPAVTNLTQSTAAAPCGGYTGVFWAPVNQASEYRLYRDNNTLSPIYTGSNLSYVDHVQVNSYHSYYVVPVINNVPQSPSNSVTAGATGYCALTLLGPNPFPYPGLVGQDVTWSIGVEGGSGIYTYSWIGDDGLTGNQKVIHHTYNAPNTYNATVTVTSSDGQTNSASRSLPVASSNGYSGIQCQGSPQQAIVGHPVTWTVSTQPPSSYSYHWTGSDSLNETGDTVTKTYSTIGLKHAEVDVVGVGSTPDCFTTVNVQWKSNIQEF